MDSDNISRKSVIDIFNNMDNQEKAETESIDANDTEKNFAKIPDSQTYFFNILSKILKTKISMLPVKEHEPVHHVIEAATKAQTKWKSTSALERSNLLHKFWKTLSEKFELLSQLENFEERDFSLFVDYFGLYSDLTILANEYKSWRPIGTVLIVLSSDCPFFVLGATVSAALGAGCSVIVQSTSHKFWFLSFLSQIFSHTGMPERLFNYILNSIEEDQFLSTRINKIVCCGSYSLAQHFYTRSLSTSFSFLCPNNTAAIILESCDLRAAVDKILCESWGSNSAKMWGVSTAVIQESIYDQFLEQLKIRMQQFMNEKKDFSKSQHQIMLDQINKVTGEAVKAGALVHKSFSCENEWSPTIILQYQDQDIESDLPILKILTCRTAKEGVSLLNNTRYCLGISIWSEISSQALEVASMLVCKNIWINCHGVMKDIIPLCPSGYSGNGVFGGIDGIFEYMSVGSGDVIVEQNKNIEEEPGPEKLTVLQTAVLANNAFTKWHKEKNRRKYLKDVAESIEKDKELANLYEMISYYAHLGNIANFSDSNSTQEFFIVQKKFPLGVIAIILNSSVIDINFITSLITPAIALGNTVILVLKEENSYIQLMAKHFNNFLPKNLLNIIIGAKGAFFLASEPIVQALWLCDESTLSTEYLKKIKFHSAKTLKNIWIVPKSVPVSQQLFCLKCLKNKAVWLTKVDQFP